MHQYIQKRVGIIKHQLFFIKKQKISAWKIGLLDVLCASLLFSFQPYEHHELRIQLDVMALVVLHYMNAMLAQCHVEWHLLAR